MPRKKKVSVEIVPASEVALVRKPKTVDLRAEIDRVIRDRVNEILAEREAVQLDDYQPRSISEEIRRNQSMFERRKWALYFAKWGCRMCRRKGNVSHSSGGCCEACSRLVVGRLAQIKREYNRSHPAAEIAENIDRLTRRMRSAKEL